MKNKQLLQQVARQCKNISKFFPQNQTEVDNCLSEELENNAKKEVEESSSDAEGCFHQETVNSENGAENEGKWVSKNGDECSNEELENIEKKNAKKQIGKVSEVAGESSLSEFIDLILRDDLETANVNCVHCIWNSKKFWAAPTRVPYRKFGPSPPLVTVYFFKLYFLLERLNFVI